MPRGRAGEQVRGRGGDDSTRSAVWPSFTCGTSATPVQTSVVTGSPDSAAHVGSPTKRSASGVGIDADAVARSP